MFKKDIKIYEHNKQNKFSFYLTTIITNINLINMFKKI